ncbi:hypothetical protein C1645_751124 [Glomus cerebriforme]|uniref:Uncharacterized protein n=1 Tax=Glomus cerebriforme TaxID=658196 RepID=A0A397TN73_9GLOM|nr:hypothetical protein C1645_751124 [Glomus cerebriforme]
MVLYVCVVCESLNVQVNENTGEKLEYCSKKCRKSAVKSGLLEPCLNCKVSSKLLQYGELLDYCDDECKWELKKNNTSSHQNKYSTHKFINHTHTIPQSSNSSHYKKQKYSSHTNPPQDSPQLINPQFNGPVYINYHCTFSNHHNTPITNEVNEKKKFSTMGKIAEGLGKIGVKFVLGALSGAHL